MKPLEPGCLAIVLRSDNPEDVGKTVTCVCHVPEGVTVELGLIANSGRFRAAGVNIRPGWLVKGDVSPIVDLVNENGTRASGRSVRCNIPSYPAAGVGIFTSEKLMRIDGFDSDLRIYEKDRDLVNG